MSELIYNRQNLFSFLCIPFTKIESLSQKLHLFPIQQVDLSYVSIKEHFFKPSSEFNLLLFLHICEVRQ